VNFDNSCLQKCAFFLNLGLNGGIFAKKTSEPRLARIRGFSGFSNSLKPEFFRDFEHIFVKGADTYFVSAVFFAYIKGCGYVDCIKAFAVGKKIILNHRIGKRFSNIVEKNVIHKLAQLNFSLCQSINIQSIFISFIKSFQRNIGFYFEQNRAYSKRTVFPNGICLGFLLFIQQNCKHKRGIKVIYHSLKSVGTRILVIVPPIQIAGNICVVRDWNNSAAFWERDFTQLGKVYHINNKSSFGFVFNRDFHPIAQVYKPTERLGGLRFLNSGSLHSNNIEKRLEPRFPRLEDFQDYKYINTAADANANAIWNLNGTVTISGGTVSAKDGYAIYKYSSNGSIDLIGGAVFAYGTAASGTTTTNVIYSSTAITPTGNAAIIAWNKSANATYDAFTDGNIYKNAGTAEWKNKDGKAGISYANGENTGFIPIEGEGIIVNKINPTVTFPTSTPITYGTTVALSTSTLSGGTGTAGTFAWTAPGTIPTVTNSGYSVTFTPTDTENYNPLTQLVPITVNPAPGTFTAPAPISTTYTPTTSLNAANNQPFPAKYTDPSGNYTTASGNITVNVAPATGTFTAPAPISTKGIYIVKIGNQTMRIAVK
jgi:hypothetical protein